MRIAKSFHFDAAHRLDRMPVDHKCHRLHGHTYRVEVYVEATRDQLDELGMIVDYAELALAWAVLHEVLDHRYLNDVPGLEVPTTEILAFWILDRLLPYPMGNGRVSGVRVYESATTFAEAP